MTQLAFGLLRFYTNNTELDEMRWTAELPSEVKQFLTEYLYPHLHARLQSDDEKEVIEKVLENIRDMADEMGPDSVKSYIEPIITAVETLLDKEAFC